MIAVADARAKEGTDSAIAFAVTLGRPARGTVTVGRGTVTPFAGLTLSESGDRTMRTGVRWAAGPEVAFGVEGTRREPANDGAPDHGIGISASLRW